MKCPNCSEEIPDSSQQCPSCSADIEQPVAEKQKEEPVHYTHYRIVLLQPGPRSSIIGLVAEITGMKDKVVSRNIQVLPWTIASRISFSEAQELKILLERSKAVVKLQGMEREELEQDSDEVRDRKIPAVKKGNRMQRLFLASIVLLIAAGTYLVVNISTKEKQGLVKFGEMQYEVSGTAGGKSDSEVIGEALPGNISPEDIRLDPNIAYFRNEGSNPFVRNLAFRFKVINPSDISIIIYHFDGTYLTTLLKGNLQAQNYRVRWNGTDDLQQRVPAGLYFVKVISPGNARFYKAVWLP